MISNVDLIVILCGLATFGLRLLPLWQARRRLDSSSEAGPRRALLEGVGPAAMTALLIISLWPRPAGDVHATTPVVIGLAFLGGLIVKRLVGGIAGPTLASAIVYGLLTQIVLS